MNSYPLSESVSMPAAGRLHPPPAGRPARMATRALDSALPAGSAPHNGSESDALFDDLSPLLPHVDGLSDSYESIAGGEMQLGAVPPGPGGGRSAEAVAQRRGSSSPSRLASALEEPAAHGMAAHAPLRQLGQEAPPGRWAMVRVASSASVALPAVPFAAALHSSSPPSSRTRLATAVPFGAEARSTAAHASAPGGRRPQEHPDGGTDSTGTPPASPAGRRGAGADAAAAASVQERRLQRRRRSNRRSARRVRARQQQETQSLAAENDALRARVAALSHQLEAQRQARRPPGRPPAAGLQPATAAGSRSGDVPRTR